MIYSKPSLTVEGPAVTEVRNGIKGLWIVLDILRIPTIGAYDAEE